LFRKVLYLAVAEIMGGIGWFRCRTDAEKSHQSGKEVYSAVDTFREDADAASDDGNGYFAQR